MDIYNFIERNARNLAPNFLTPSAKKIISYPRYYNQLKKCRSQYNMYKEKYKQHVLFVAGLPKSGTTWFEKMLGSLPGFSDVMIPEAVNYEQKHKESHTFEFPDNLFTRFKNALVVLKLHAHGSLHNFELLQKNNIRYVVIYRDLRDVAVSHIFYVKRTAYHPEHKIYKNLNIKEALLHFAETLRPEFVQWIDSWHQYELSPLSYVLRYEDLITEPFQKMKEVAEHYGMHTSDKELNEIINKNSFENLSGGRKKGNVDTSSFFRSGISGNWKKYFDDELMEAFDIVLHNNIEKYSL
jgi:hypothetical protein